MVIGLLVGASMLAACASGEGATGTIPGATDPPTTEAQTTDSSATDLPASDPPMTDPPVTDPPMTDPPVTDVPAPVEAAPPVATLNDEFVWSVVTPTTGWEPRAGLRVVELGGRLFTLGGRTPKQSTTPGDSVIHGDVWVSEDGGSTWTEIVEQAPWPARAYFQALVKDDMIYVIGGQDFGLEENPFCALLDQGLEPPPGLGIDPDAPCPEFLPTSNFFNDVWRSADGVEWEQMTPEAPWAGRAGLSAVALDDHLYVLAGSQNDDSSIIGPGGPQRIYYNDVWRSADGAEWEQMTDAAPWEPRAGAAVVARDDRLYLFGGEDGFTCEPLPDCEAPYFNDVWSTTDGATWDLVTEAAGWSPRPGHVCELLGNQFICFGGFGLIENPDDVWVSVDGRQWAVLDDPVWNAADPTLVKYDFDALVVDGTTVLTFGGDRETFDFSDPENSLRVDNDVWRFAPAS